MKKLMLLAAVIGFSLPSLANRPGEPTKANKNKETQVKPVSVKPGTVKGARTEINEALRVDEGDTFNAEIPTFKARQDVVDILAREIKEFADTVVREKAQIKGERKTQIEVMLSSLKPAFERYPKLIDFISKNQDSTDPAMKEAVYSAIYLKRYIERSYFMASKIVADKQFLVSVETYVRTFNEIAKLDRVEIRAEEVVEVAKDVLKAFGRKDLTWEMLLRCD